MQALAFVSALVHVIGALAVGRDDLKGFRITFEVVLCVSIVAFAVLANIGLPDEKPVTQSAPEADAGAAFGTPMTFAWVRLSVGLMALASLDVLTPLTLARGGMLGGACARSLSTNRARSLYI